jgi:hypothetical protein
MSTKQVKKQKQKPKKGDNAILSVIKNSGDQVKTFVTKRYGGKGGLVNVASDITKLYSMLNVENKECDTQVTATSVIMTGSTVQGLPTCAQGTTGQTRTGDSIKVDRIDINLLFKYSSGTTATSTVQHQIFNYYVVRNLKTPTSLGTNPFAIGDFLDSDENGNYTPSSLPNTDTAEDYQILDAGEVVLTLMYAPAASAFAHKLVHLSILCGFHQTYNGAAGSSITDNMCFLVITASQVANVGGSSTFSMNARSWFIDN